MRKPFAVVLLLCGCIEVDTSSGVVLGHPVENQTVIEFLGIRYAEPPVGPLRFAPPRPRARQTEKYNAARMGDSCADAEDCLFLNVWSPKDAANLPVMVYLHGGAFTMGQAPNAAQLAKKGNVVAVTINYRLGVFGFLAHPALAAEPGNVAGNYGLLDQQLALRWVKDNIAAFGGDPNNVTVFGESAGAVSVCAHLVSPRAAGLFQRAIAQSGSCAIGFLPRARAEQTGGRLAQSLSCSGDVPTCLRAASRDALMAAVPAKLELDANADKWMPVADGSVLPLDALGTLGSGAQHRVPYLSGTTGNEGSLFTATMKLDTRADFEALVHKMLPTKASDALAFYSEQAYPAPRAAATALLSDAFVCGQRKVARLVAPHLTGTYLYQFTRANPSLSWNLGATHGSDVPYVFGDISFPLTVTPEDTALSDSMIGYWTRFARTGDPNGAGAVAWPRFENVDERYLELDVPISAKARLQASRCDTLDPLLVP